MRERAEAEGGGPSWTKTQNPKFTLKVMVENSELKHREKIWPRSLATGYGSFEGDYGTMAFTTLCCSVACDMNGSLHYVLPQWLLRETQSNGLSSGMCRPLSPNKVLLFVYYHRDVVLVMGSSLTISCLLFFLTLGHCIGFTPKQQVTLSNFIQYNNKSIVLMIPDLGWGCVFVSLLQVRKSIKESP